MKLPRQKRDETSAAITPTLGLIVVCSGLFALTAYASDPSWWSSLGTGTQPAVISPPQVVTNDGVVTTNYIPNNYAVVSQGQLKQFTARAVDDLNAGLPGGAGTSLTNLVYGWAQDYLTNGYATNMANPTMPYKPSDLQAENVGQLKYVAGLIYTQLACAGYTGLYPSWIAQNTNTDGAAANLGQLKEVFNFDLSVAPAAVSNLTTTVPADDEIDLFWTLPSMDNATSLTVLESTNDGTNWTAVITNLSPTATSYDASGLSTNSSYLFEVVDSNAIGSSSNTTASSQPPIPIPAPPTGLTGTLDGSDNMDLTWTASTGAASYVIDRETLATGTWALAYGTSSSASFTDTNYVGDNPELGYVEGGYHYRVSAVNAAGASSPSTEYPHSRYAVIDLGTNMVPQKITDSGFILMQNSDGTCYRWSNGTASALNAGSSTNEYLCLPDDIGEDGTVVGYAGFLSGSTYTIQEALWPPTNSAPTISPPLTEVAGEGAPGSPDAGEVVDYWSSDEAVAIDGTNIISQRTADAIGEYLYYYATTDPTDLFVNGVEQGSVTNPNPDDQPDSPGYYVYDDPAEYIFDPQDQLIAANDSGQMLVNETYWNMATGSPTNQIQLGATTLDFNATGLSNPVLGTTYAVGTDTNDVEGIWWDGVDEIMTDGFPLALSARTGLTTGGSAAPALQMTGYHNDYDGIPLLWRMDPNTGLFGSAQTVADLFPANAPWTGFGPIEVTGENADNIQYKPVNDSGAIIGQAYSTIDGSLHGLELLPCQFRLLNGDTNTADVDGMDFNGNRPTTITATASYNTSNVITYDQEANEGTNVLGVDTPLGYGRPYPPSWVGNCYIDSIMMLAKVSPPAATNITYGWNRTYQASCATITQTPTNTWFVKFIPVRPGTGVPTPNQDLFPAQYIFQTTVPSTNNNVVSCYDNPGMPIPLFATNSPNTPNTNDFAYVKKEFFYSLTNSIGSASAVAYQNVGQIQVIKRIATTGVSANDWTNVINTVSTTDIPNCTNYTTSEIRQIVGGSEPIYFSTNTPVGP